MTVLYNSPIFGPVISRRLGVSLGVNLMPADGKLCTFDCLYCECGLNASHRPKQRRPRREEVAEKLEAVLSQRAQDNLPLDVITFAGNGEPTLHPDFSLIINDTIALRDRYFPKAQVSVLSNATAVERQSVREALNKVDNNILKLDTVDPTYIALVDRPSGIYDVDKIVSQLAAFSGHVIIQTMFVTGEANGVSVDNTGDIYVNPWLDALARIAPQKVMIYTIDRETPVKGLQKVEPDVLDSIARRVRDLGLNVSVSY